MLACPECQPLSGPTSVNFMNGITSLFEFGLEGSYGGFGPGGSSNREVFDDQYSSGNLTYTPASTDPVAIVNELATLLTSGRLSAEKRALLTNVFSSPHQYTTEQAVKSVGQLIASTPEFHANGLSHSTTTARATGTTPPTTTTPYKSVVYFILNGGYDVRQWFSV